jgi:hypothetical protein
MNDANLDFPSNTQIGAKIDYRPAEAVPAGLIVVRDANNQILKKIELNPENIDSWFDLTEYLQHAGRGFVEVLLLRTVGHGPWRARLFLRTSPAADQAEAHAGDQRNYLTASVTFRRKP